MGKDPIPRAVKQRWRDYETPGGRRPVKEFIASLDDEDAAEVIAAMKDASASRKK